MASYSASTSPTHPGSRGLWNWLLRHSGLAAWFRQAPATAHTGREERVFLAVALPGGATRPSSSHATLLAEALLACQPTLRASGGEVVSQQAREAVLSWPVAAGGPPAVHTYFQLREAVRQLADGGAALYGAASLGWVRPQWTGMGWRYRGEVVGQLAGILREGQQLGSDLLLAAALRQQLASALSCELHVGFDVAGHRYPATLYRVASLLVN